MFLLASLRILALVGSFMGPLPVDLLLLLLFLSCILAEIRVLLVPTVKGVVHVGGESSLRWSI